MRNSAIFLENIGVGVLMKISVWMNVFDVLEIFAESRVNWIEHKTNWLIKGEINFLSDETNNQNYLISLYKQLPH